MLTKEFYINTRKNLLNLIPDNSIVVLFAGESPYKSADARYVFMPNKNFLYLTGLKKEKFILTLKKYKGEITQTLYIEKNDPVLAKWIGEAMPPEEAKKISGIEDVRFLDGFNADIGGALTGYDYDHLYLDLEGKGWETPYGISRQFAQEIKTKFPAVTVKNVFHQIASLRMIKTPEEVNMIREAINITNKGIMHIVDNLNPGMKENEAEAYFDFMLKKLGTTPSFDTIAAAGKNAAVLHYVDNNAMINDGDMILLDLGAHYNYYCADITRTIPANGKYTQRQKDVYSVVLEAELAVMEAAKPGVPHKELNEVCKKVLAEGCIKLGLIKDATELSRYYYHGVAHHLGLDVHDVGGKDCILQPGMVLTNEPGLYIPEENIGIRIEDDMLITENGREVLSKGIMKTIEEIEMYMKK